MLAVFHIVDYYFYYKVLEKYALSLTDEQIKREIVIWYKKFTGKEMDIDNPQTYNEKIQWTKFYDATPLKARLADKVAVREYVKEKIGEDVLIPILGIWESFDEIEFDSLPEKFVLKANHGSGMVLVVKNKSQLDLKKVKKQLDQWMDTAFEYACGFEMQYHGIPRKIIAEKYMISENENDLPDYKFFCFQGRVFCSYTMLDYTIDHSKGRLGFFDRDYKLLPYYRKDFLPLTEQPAVPKNYSKMLEIAECLSDIEEISHMRVDLYNIDGEIYFGELTFTNGSGYQIYEPEKFDQILGEQWKLPSYQNS